MSRGQEDPKNNDHRYVWNLRDDITYVFQAREMLLQHPSRIFVPKLLNAAFCRLYMIVIVAYFELVFRMWVEVGRDKHGVIGKYLKEKSRRPKKGESPSTHDTRLETLQAAFASADILVDPDVLADYSAIERLRNIIVHTSPKEKDEQFIHNQGFPSDPAKLNDRHFLKIHHIMTELMGYLERSDGIEPSDQEWHYDPSSLLTQPFREPNDQLKLVRTRDIPGMFWLNLERISAHIQPDIRRVIEDEKYSWRNELSTRTLANLYLSSDELRIHEHLVARKASESGVTALVQHRHLGEVALESWREYWRQLFESRGFAVAKMREAAATLVAAHEGRDYHSEQFLNALSMASAVGQITRNAGAIGLLAIELPIIDPPRTVEYLEEAEKALCAFTLMLYYGALKNWADTFGLEMRDDDMRESQQNIDFYRRMIDAYRES